MGRNGELRAAVGVVVAGRVVAVEPLLAGVMDAAPFLLLLPPAILAPRDLREPWSSAITAEVLEPWDTYKDCGRRKKGEIIRIVEQFTKQEKSPLNALLKTQFRTTQ